MDNERSVLGAERVEDRFSTGTSGVFLFLLVSFFRFFLSVFFLFSCQYFSFPSPHSLTPLLSSPGRAVLRTGVQPADAGHVLPRGGTAERGAAAQNLSPKRWHWWWWQRWWWWWQHYRHEQKRLQVRTPSHCLQQGFQGFRGQADLQCPHTPQHQQYGCQGGVGGRGRGRGGRRHIQHGCQRRLAERIEFKREKLVCLYVCLFFPHLPR